MGQNLKKSRFTNKYRPAVSGWDWSQTTTINVTDTESYAWGHNSKTPGNPIQHAKFSWPWGRHPHGAQPASVHLFVVEAAGFFISFFVAIAAPAGFFRSVGAAFFLNSLVFAAAASSSRSPQQAWIFAKSSKNMSTERHSDTPRRVSLGNPRKT